MSTVLWLKNIEKALVLVKKKNTLVLFFILWSLWKRITKRFCSSFCGSAPNPYIYRCKFLAPCREEVFFANPLFLNVLNIWKMSNAIGGRLTEMSLHGLCVCVSVYPRLWLQNENPLRPASSVREKSGTGRTGRDGRTGTDGRMQGGGGGTDRTMTGQDGRTRAIFFAELSIHNSDSIHKSSS